MLEIILFRDIPNCRRRGRTIITSETSKPTRTSCSSTSKEQKIFDWPLRLEMSPFTAITRFCTSFSPSGCRFWFRTTSGTNQSRWRFGWIYSATPSTTRTSMSSTASHTRSAERLAIDPTIIESARENIRSPMHGRLVKVDTITTITRSPATTKILSTAAATI